MVLELVILNITDGMGPQYEAALEQAKPIIAASPGFHHLVLRRCIETPNRYALLIHWDTLEAHTKGFRESPAFQEWRALLSPFYASPPQVEHYDFVTEIAPTD